MDERKYDEGRKEVKNEIENISDLIEMNKQCVTHRKFKNEIFK